MSGADSKETGQSGQVEPHSEAAAELVCCKCRFWRLCQRVQVKGRGEVFLGLCRYTPPRFGWPLTEEHDTCHRFEAKSYAQAGE